MIDPVEFSHALTMIPFAFLTYYSKTDLQAFFITVMWLSSAMYHGLVSFGMTELGYRYYALDCTFQVTSILLLVMSSPCYATNQKLQRSISHMGFAAIAMICVCAMGGIATNKSVILHIVLGYHVIHAVYGFFYVCDRSSYGISMCAFVASWGLFVADENGTHYAWAIGHLVTITYTWYFWKALSMTSST